MLYGARVVDGDLEGGQRVLPFLHFEAFDRRELETHNLIDLGALAHRRDLPEAHFDESLSSGGDWDLALRLSETTTPLALPLVGSIYHVSASNRITFSETVQEGYDRLKARMRRTAPLRVLLYGTPDLLETDGCVEEESEALRHGGATLGRCVDGPLAPAPPEATFTDLYAAVELFDPDVIVLHEIDVARRRVEALDDIGLPFALRVPADDAGGELAESLRHDPLCVGVWICPDRAGTSRAATGDAADAATFVAALTAAVHQQRLRNPSTPVVAG
jgi:hypothetical protein